MFGTRKLKVENARLNERIIMLEKEIDSLKNKLTLAESVQADTINTMSRQNNELVAENNTLKEELEKTRASLTEEIETLKASTVKKLQSAKKSTTKKTEIVVPDEPLKPVKPVKPIVKKKDLANPIPVPKPVKPKEEVKGVEPKTKKKK